MKIQNEKSHRGNHYYLILNGICWRKNYSPYAWIKMKFVIMNCYNFEKITTQGYTNQLVNQNDILEEKTLCSCQGNRQELLLNVNDRPLVAAHIYGMCMINFFPTHRLFYKSNSARISFVAPCRNSPINFKILNIYRRIYQMNL